MGNDLESSREISTHHSLPRKEKTEFLRNRNFWSPEDLDKGKRFLIRQISIRFLLTQNQTCVDSLNTVAKVLKPTWLKSIRTWTSSESSNHAKLNRGYETKYFVASHRRSDFTKFLVTKLHFQFNPVSFIAVKVSIRNHSVILGLGTFYAQIKISCPQYKKLRTASMKQQRAPLPKRRVNCRMNPFEHVGINYAGPFKLKLGRAKARKEVWILI